MKIRVWNVNKGFAKKVGQAFSCDPEIAILPESARNIAVKGRKWKWVGQNDASGLGVSISESIPIVDFKQAGVGAMWFSATTLDLPSPLVVIAVWACYERSPRKADKGPVNTCLKEILSLVQGRDAIIAGDFNNSAEWDQSGRADNFSNTVDAFSEAGLVSAYHRSTGEKMGAETVPTFFSRRSQANSHHIDFCFIPESWADQLVSVEVGKFEEWIALSDHMPITVEIKKV